MLNAEHSVQRKKLKPLIIPLPKDDQRSHVNTGEGWGGVRPSALCVFSPRNHTAYIFATLSFFTCQYIMNIDPDKITLLQCNYKSYTVFIV